MNHVFRRSLASLSMALAAACLLVPGSASAATVVGVLVGGGGIDDMFVTVRDAKGKEFSAYCLDKCGDIFGPADQHDVVKVKPRLLKRKVKLDYYTEMNKDRIAGPGEERLEFVRKLELLR